MFRAYIGVEVNHTIFKKCRVRKLSLVRANDFNLINHDMLNKKNMTSNQH